MLVLVCLFVCLFVFVHWGVVLLVSTGSSGLLRRGVLFEELQVFKRKQYTESCFSAVFDHNWPY